MASRRSGTAIVLILVAGLLLPPGASGISASPNRRHPVRRADSLPTPAHVLWIGAHPDDEILFSPVLADWCLDRSVQCTFLVATRGEAGTCELPGGCGPDLGRVRSFEMETSAALYGATLVQWSLSDGGGADGRWSTESGSEAALIESLKNAIVASGADVVFTFDEHHGSTFHPDHRELGRLVREAMLGIESEVLLLILLETVVDIAFVNEEIEIGFRGDASSESWDARRLLPRLGVPAWVFVERQMRVHATQFDEPWLDAIDLVTEDQWRVWWSVESR